MHNKIKIVILAAGKGTRMKSELPKALAQVRGKYMLHHLLESIRKVHSDKPVLVVGHKADLVKKELGNQDFIYALQEEQLGTAHAVAAAQQELAGAENIMIFYADAPFISSESIKKIIDHHLNSGATVTFVTATVPSFEGKYKNLLYFRVPVIQRYRKRGATSVPVKALKCQ